MKKTLFFTFTFIITFYFTNSEFVFANDDNNTINNYGFNKETNTFTMNEYSYTITENKVLEKINSWEDIAISVFYEPEYKYGQWYYRYRIILYPYTSNLYIYSYWNSSYKDWRTIALSYNYTTKTETEFIRLGFIWHKTFAGEPDDINYAEIYNAGEQGFVVANYDFDSSSLENEVETCLLTRTYTTKTIYYYDNDNQMYSDSVFLKPLPVVTETLGTIVAKMEMNPLKEIIAILPMMIICLVGYLALQKALVTLQIILFKE